MDNYPLHLAVAAMAGASLAAVYTYCAHRRALSELLDSALASEAERDRSGGTRLVPRLRRRRQDRRRSTSSSGAAGAAASGGSHRRHAIPRDMAGTQTHRSLLGEVASLLLPWQYVHEEAFASMDYLLHTLSLYQAAVFHPRLPKEATLF